MCHWLEKDISLLFGISSFHICFFKLLVYGEGKLVIPCAWLFIHVVMEVMNFLVSFVEIKVCPILVEIVRIASAVGFGEDWLKLLLSRICLEENQFPQLFARLCPIGAFENGQDLNFRDAFFVSEEAFFVSEQAFLSSIVSEFLNKQIGEIHLTNDFASCVFGILKHVAGAVDCVSSDKRNLPTGSTVVDILGYSLSILRDLCAHDSVGFSKVDESVDVLGSLLSSGLLELLLCLLHDLEPLTTIRKAMKQNEDKKGTVSYSSKCCAYKGSLREIVAVIGNCAYRRKHVQDEVRERNGILLLLQQCVVDNDNPFLMKRGIWAVRNLSEGNAENQRAVAELEVQGSVDVPEITRLGLKVEMDQKTRRAKLVLIMKIFQAWIRFAFSWSLIKFCEYRLLGGLQLVDRSGRILLKTSGSTINQRGTAGVGGGGK